MKIAQDGTVTLMAHRSEMGQGIRTGLAQLMADELEADWSRVVVQQAEGDNKYGDQYTDGSRSIVKNFDRLRAVRRLPPANAGTGRGRPMGCRSERGQGARTTRSITPPRGARSAMAILSRRAGTLPVPRPETVKLKDRKDWKYHRQAGARTTICRT